MCPTAMFWLPALVLAAAFVATTAPASAAEKPLVLDVWPGTAPGEKGDIGPEQFSPPQKEPKPIQRLGNVTKPTLAVYRPEKAKDTGAAVVICPGGGYNILAMDLEGRRSPSGLVRSA